MLNRLLKQFAAWLAGSTDSPDTLEPRNSPGPPGFSEKMEGATKGPLYDVYNPALKARQRQNRAYYKMIASHKTKTHHNSDYVTQKKTT